MYRENNRTTEPNTSELKSKPGKGGRRPPVSAWIEADESEIIDKPETTKATKSPKKSKPEPRKKTSKRGTKHEEPHIPERKLRKNYVVHFMGVAVVLVIILYVLSTTVLFNINNVAINGESAYSDEEIIAAGGIENGQNLIRFDSERAQRNILTALVHLDEVEVKKVFPSTIAVTVTTAERLFSVYAEGLYLDVSHNGRIIGNSSSRPEGLLVTGLIPKSTRVGDFLDCEREGLIEPAFRLSSLVEQHGLYGVDRIDVSDRFDMKLFYERGGEANEENTENRDRIEIRLDIPLQLDEKMAVAAKIITEELAPGESGVLKVPNSRRATFVPDG